MDTWDNHDSWCATAGQVCGYGLPCKCQEEKEEKNKVIVYAAFRSVPDYSAPSPPLLSIHQTLYGAMFALYPEDKHPVSGMFRKWPEKAVWEGPDGFGMVKEMEVLP